MFVVVCFNCTATTEIDTYGHTLSLPGVFPICTGKGHLSGDWGFERFDGPDFALQLPGDAAWKVAGDPPTLVVGRDNGLTLTGDAPACVEGVTLRQIGRAHV